MDIHPRLGSIQAWPSISTEVHHAERLTARAQPVQVESNAVPEPRRGPTGREGGAFGRLACSAGTGCFRHAQTWGTAAHWL